MTISDELVIHAAHAIADIDGNEADAGAMLKDAYLLSLAFAREEDFLNAVANTQRALGQLARNAVSPARLKYEHQGWLSYHYQHKVAQGQRADMRIVLCRTDAGIRLRAFGHRSLPKDFYERLAENR